MSSAGTVTVDFAAETARFTAELKKVRSDIGRIKDEVSSANRVIQGFGNAFKGVVTVAAFTGAIRAVAAATAEAERSVALLNNALGSTNANVAAASQDLQNYASALQSTTTYSDDAIMGVETLLLSFSGLSGDTIKRATAAVLDLSTRMGIDAPAAAKLLGKALSDPEKGMTALARAGVMFGDQQKEQIKALKDSGDAAKAQGIILAELERRFGGAAVAARNTLGGALEGLSNSFGDLLEQKTGIPAAVTGINELSTALADPKVKEAADTAFGAIAKSLGVLVKLSADAVRGIDGMAAAFARIKVPGAELSTAAALTKELTIAQNELRDRVSLGIYPADAIARDQAYIETLKQRIELARQAAEAPKPAAQPVTPAENPMDFTTGNGVKEISAATKAYEEFQKKAALERLQGLGGSGDDVALQLYQDQQARRLEFESNVNEQIQNGRIEMERETVAATAQIANDSLETYVNNADERLEIERTLQEKILGIRSGAVNAAVGLLQVLSTRSKAAAKALILINRGLSIAQAVQNTAVAVTKALAIDPTGALAARVKVMGAVEIGLIAATGALEIGQVSAGNSGAVVGPGTVHNPVYTESGDGERTYGADSRPAVQVTITGYIGREQIDQMVSAIKEEVGARDVVIIAPGSRQAQELRQPS